MEAAITTKLTSKSQATIPEKIRKILGLRPGAPGGQREHEEGLLLLRQQIAELGRGG